MAAALLTGVVAALPRADGGGSGTGCQHSGHAATHQMGVERVALAGGVATTLAVHDGDDVKGSGQLCAEACCDAGPANCRFWSVSSGACTLFPRYAAPRSVGGPAAATTASGAVYHGASPHNNVSGEFAGLKGFNYFPASSMNDIDMWRDYDAAAIERELGWAAHAGFNFCRTWFNFVVWDAEGQRSMSKLQHFVATAHALGIRTMIAPFNAYETCRTVSGDIPHYNFSAACFFSSPADAAHLGINSTAWWKDKGEKYVDALTSALPHTTPGLALWDVCNEPHPEWYEFVLHFVAYFQTKTATPTTVGVTQWSVLNTSIATDGGSKTIGEAVDVLTYHSYFPSWELGLQTMDDAAALAARLGKPIFLSEFGCIARANAYDQGIELASLYGMGWTLWELMVLTRESEPGTTNRRNIHGIIYADGSVRDTAAIAAVRGFFVNRGQGNATLAPGIPNEENHGTAAIGAARTWLALPAHRQLGDFLTPATVLGTISNLLEASGTTPMSLPVSGFARSLHKTPPTEEARQSVVLMLAAQADALEATMDGPVGVNSGVAGHNVAQYDSFEPGIAVYHRPNHTQHCCEAQDLALCGPAPP